MDNVSDLGAGLAALAFWGFVAACVIGGIWDNIKKRETKHETLRRLVESGQPLNEDLLKRLDMLTKDSEERFDRGFIITALWLLPISAGMAVFGYFMGSVDVDAQTAMFGVSGLLAIMGTGCLIAGKSISHWYIDNDKKPDFTARPGR